MSLPQLQFLADGGEMGARLREVEANLYRTLRARYQVEVEAPPVAQAAGKAGSEVAR